MRRKDNTKYNKTRQLQIKETKERWMYERCCVTEQLQDKRDSFGLHKKTIYTKTPQNTKPEKCLHRYRRRTSHVMERICRNTE